MTLNLPRELSNIAEDAWHRFCNAGEAQGIIPPGDTETTSLIRHAFALSRFVSETCIQTPEVLKDLITSGDLYASYQDTCYKAAVTDLIKREDDLIAVGRLLRTFRRREMVRIAIRDLAGMAGLNETMQDLSGLASESVDGAVTALYQEMIHSFGIPCSEDGEQQHFCVIGMGKLGAFELNFSSDIDLIFAYPKAGATTHTDTPITCDQFFTRLSRQFLKLFGPQGGDAPLFRVDMRLRPFGDNGPIVMNFDAIESYYTRQGREWERYALIKARAVAGDTVAGSRLLERLKPFVYRRYFDYGAYDSLREMKRMIELEVTRKGLERNIKTGKGGIREIEFFGQIFQLIRGGVEPDLQVRNILSVLSVLVAYGYVPTVACEELTQAYVFLRNCEHRLQEYSDRQTHDLPTDPTEQLILAVSMGFASWDTFHERLCLHRSNVRKHFNELLADTPSEKDSLSSRLAALWTGSGDPASDRTILESAGFREPDEALRLLHYLKNDFNTRSLSSTGRKRLSRLIPLLLKETGTAQTPELCLARLIDLIKTIERRSSYLSLLAEQPAVLSRLVYLSGESPWITSYLSAHPVLLDDLVDDRTLFRPPEKEELRNTISRQVTATRPDELEITIEQLTIFKLSNTLRVAAADISGAYPLMKVSDYLTFIAEVVLEKAMDLSWDFLVERHGAPMLSEEPPGKGAGFAIIGYGKLGGIELGYGSDLDLVFLCSQSDGMTQGRHPVSSIQFYSRLAQRIVHLLTTYTRTGKMYDVDMRLRPGGISGSVVSTVKAFDAYLNTDAWTWEHQALVRTRPICGDPSVISQFETIRQTVLTAKRDPKRLKEEIRTMRETIRRQHNTAPAGLIDIKHGRGTIIDIEFLVQYLVLSGAAEHPVVATWPDNVRQLEALATHGVITMSDASFLTEAFLTFRKMVHRFKLQEKPALIEDHLWNDIRTGVSELWDHYMGETQ